MTHKITAKRYLKVFCLMIVLSACSCETFETLFPQITDEEVQEVKNICANLKPPPSFVKTHEDFDIVKPGHANRSMQFSSPAEPEEVEEYFVKLLTQSGWSYYKERRGDVMLRFKKGKYAINIEMPGISFTTNKIYLVGCSIGLY